MTAQNLLIKIVKSGLTETEVPLTENIEWKSLIVTAKKQGLLQFVCDYANKLSVDQAVDDNVRMYLFSALVQETARSTHQLEELRLMQTALQNKGIYSLALKGSVTKLRYSNEVLRTMGDIDILYKVDQHKEFKKVMFELGYGDYKEGRKNDVYHKPPFIIVEAHREMLETGSEYYGYYSDIWEKAHPKKGLLYTYEMSVEDEFIFNIVHLAEHFKEGGAGIRFIIDTYVYSQLEMDTEYLEKELEKLGLLEFYKNILNLADYWFADAQSCPLTDRLAQFILSGGVFGSDDNRAALAVEKGRAKLLFGAVFPSYDSMKTMFPWLKGKKILLPVAWGLRGYKAVFHRKHNVHSQLTDVCKGDKEKGKALRELLDECGLIGG